MSPPLTDVLALDCEMVGTGPNGSRSMVARASLVNEYGQCVYDRYVKAFRTVTDYRTPITGIEPRHLNSGGYYDDVKKIVADLIRGRILVGHTINNDLRVLGLCHPHYNIRDLAVYFQNGRGTQSLKTLAWRYLGLEIQNGYHSSVEDARASMYIYKHFQDEWESSDESESDDVSNYYYDSSDY